MTKKLEHDEFLAQLAKSEIGEKLAAERATKRLAERKRLAKMVATTRASLEKALPIHEQAIDAAVQKLKDAEAAVEAAREDVRRARAARASDIHNHDSAVALFTEELKGGASPAVTEFVRYLRDQLHALPRMLTIERDTFESLNGTRVLTSSNKATLAERQQALLTALRDLCPRLELEPDDAVVAAEIEKAKAALPIIAPAPANEGNEK